MLEKIFIKARTDFIKLTVELSDNFGKVCYIYVFFLLFCFFVFLIDVVQVWLWSKY